MGGLTPGVTRITLRDLATMMVAVSDNSATNVLIGRVGMDNVNAMLDSLGLAHTRLRRKMMDLDAAKQGRENISTPREMMMLLEMIYRGKLLNKESTADFFKVLSTNKNSWIPRDLPADVKSANKPGALEGVRNDSGVVFVEGRPYVICVTGNRRSAGCLLPRGGCSTVSVVLRSMGAWCLRAAAAGRWQKASPSGR
jgi:beta-lactamase class A